MSLLHEEFEASQSTQARNLEDSRVRLSARAKIVDRLLDETGSNEAVHRLTVMRAPAGYGKTRTIRGWLGDAEKQNEDLRWLHCTPEHSGNPDLFWEAVARTLDFTYSGVDDLANAAPLSDQVQSHTSSLVAQLTKPITLVIDDYNHATSAENDIALSHLAAASPMLTLVVIARRVTLLDRTVVTAGTIVRVVGPEELALTLAESFELASSLGVPMSDALAAALEQADGWPLAVRAALNLGSDEFYHGPPNERRWNENASAADFDPIANLDSFAVDAVELLPAHCRELLFATALLDQIGIGFDQLSAAFDDGDGSAEQAAQQLLELGLLVEETQGDTTEYRCHRAISAPLRAFAVRNADPQLMRCVYGTRAKALSASAPFTAFQLACAAEDYALAESLLARNFTTITDEGELCAQSLRAVPEAELRRHPTLVAGMIMLELPRSDTASSTLKYLSTLWSAGLEAQLTNDERAQQNPLYKVLLGQAMVGARQSGHFDKSRTIMRYLESRLTPQAVEPENHGEARSNLSLIGSLPSYFHETAVTGLVVGDLVHARRNLERLRHFAERQISRPRGEQPRASTRRVSDVESGQRWLLTALGELAFTEMIEGNIHESAALLAETAERISSTGTFFPGISWVGSELARANISVEVGDPSMLHTAVKRLTPIIDRVEGWQLLLVAETASLRESHGPVWALSHLETSLTSTLSYLQPKDNWSEYLMFFRVMLNTTIGDLARAQQTLAEHKNPESPRHRIEQARLALFAGEDVEALLIAQRIGDPGTTARQRLDRALIVAITAWICGREAEAFQAIGTAAELLERHGIPSVIRNVPYDLLRDVATAAQAAGFADLLPYLDAVPELARSERYDRLTEMELRTLRAITEHRTAKDAAAALFVTLGTVKKHLASVYRKLRVSGRDEAILQASRMGMLD
ncbi:LuxR C-terminal-related transcriptional regulator [Leucobacter sp. UT-8R-CII-1-4]|uniref:helix-turn-helix transcriptional regulator n=1 Tax=Leucobacter sp. UT-8R-CII-1-4 TaxID=3040075 RepID=UPI0024A90D25|nr:LuxR C-terminal-related transcriptional regulator [Leucobacter sp. UT-8R-CII-1-4]MDI6022435.1 LuxR C-terminal-related transcriptional regulator [Leucobacter sp. UT-8R-CII-1-4]